MKAPCCFVDLSGTVVVDHMNQPYNRSELWVRGDIRAFDNDMANDWAYGLEETDDLSLVKSAFVELDQGADEDGLDSDLACNALAACEVLARLLGRPGYNDSYTEKVDDWVKAHRSVPPPALIVRANAAIDRVLAEDSELRELWDESEEGETWRKSVEELRARLTGKSP